MLSWALLSTMLVAAPTPIANLGLGTAVRCEMVLTVLEAAAAAPGSPVSCGASDRDRDGRQVALASLATSKVNGFLPSLFSPTSLCRNRNFQVLGDRVLSRPHPKTMLTVAFEQRAKREWLFKVSLAGFPTTPGEGSVFLCGWTTGVVRRQHGRWVPRIETQ
jgi:hypothetical protein